jgi:hypothetical protein
MRKMFRTTGILSKDARTSPVVAAGSIRGSLAICRSLFLLLVDAETSALSCKLRYEFRARISA